MRLYPAIDIRDGKCVRLKQGLFDNVKVYSQEPWKIAEQFERDGARFIHVVDLDGAQKGHSVNADVIRRIAGSVNIPIELGGGIRTIKDIEDVLALGVFRVIIGTKAVENPEFISEANRYYSIRRCLADERFAKDTGSRNTRCNNRQSNLRKPYCTKRRRKHI